MAAISRCGFRKCQLFGAKALGTLDSVQCSKFRGGRFSEVANVLQVTDFQSVTTTLSALCSLVRVSAQGGSTVYIHVHPNIRFPCTSVICGLHIFICLANTRK